MFIHGGIDDYDNILHDSWLLDLNNLRWIKIEIKGPKISLAFHSSALAYFSDKRHHNAFSFFKVIDPSLAKCRKFKNEGIYFFGGIDDENKHRNDIKLLKIGKKVAEWYFPRTEGQAPCGRTSCSLNYYEELNVLILHGGKSEYQEFLSDTYILDLENYIWNKITIFDSIPIARAEHSAIISNYKLIIFGGINSSNFIGSDTYIINLSKDNIIIIYLIF